MTRSFRFAKAIAGTLRGAKVETIPGKEFRVTGRLDVGATLANVTVVVPWRFQKLKHRGCTVTCNEPWMKRGLEWHNFETWMCWMLPDQWRDYMAWKGKSTHQIISEGSNWLITSARSLISRHYCAHLLELSEWPREWSAWGHGLKGIAEYDREAERSGIGRLSKFPPLLTRQRESKPPPPTATSR